MTSDCVDLWVGSPVPQRQTVIVDTGSGNTAFRRRGCGSDCGGGYHTNAIFDDTELDTFTRITDRDNCALVTYIKGEGGYRVSMSYQEGSTWKPTRPRIGCAGVALNVRPSTSKRTTTRTRTMFNRIPSRTDLDFKPIS